MSSSRGPTIALAALGVVVSNLFSLSAGFNFLRTEVGYVKADTGALPIAGARTSAGLWLVQPVARDIFLSGITAGRCFAETRAHGTPAFFTPAQIIHAPVAQRMSVDSVLATAYQIAPRPILGSSARCRRLRFTTGRAGPELPLAAGTTMITDLGGTPLVASVRRFAPPGMAVAVGFVTGRTNVRLEIPRDAVAVPWWLSLRDSSGAPGVDVSACAVIRSS